MMDVVQPRPSDTGANYERASETSLLTPVNHFYGGTASLIMYVPSGFCRVQFRFFDVYILMLER